MDIKWEKADDPKEAIIEAGDLIACGDNDGLLYLVVFNLNHTTYKLLSLSEHRIVSDYWEHVEQLSNWLIKEYGDYTIIKNRRLELTIKKP